jgi:hypothetical protein
VFACSSFSCFSVGAHIYIMLHCMMRAYVMMQRVDGKCGMHDGRSVSVCSSRGRRGRRGRPGEEKGASPHPSDRDWSSGVAVRVVCFLPSSFFFVSTADVTFVRVRFNKVHCPRVHTSNQHA